ncbi:MAG TPA: DUF4282 domain-containing protein [Thermoguttaceae bacterium]|nr:DUF4282 domain-containing protein [Thermoguttaceae bacterium]
MGERAQDEVRTDRDAEPTLDDFWAFRTMLTPVLVQVIFWLGVIGCIAWGAYQIVLARHGETWDQLEVARGAAWVVFGPMAVRLACEAVILFFRINETLTEIKNKLK